MNKFIRAAEFVDKVDCSMVALMCTLPKKHYAKADLYWDELEVFKDKQHRVIFLLFMALV